jgi:opacity protein-like surface antigen
MKLLDGFTLCLRTYRAWRKCLVGLAPILLLTGSHWAWGQAAESADAGGAMLSVGVALSGFALQYGDRGMLGITAWVDADTIRRFGVEGEMRRLEYHQTANVHAETYLAGLRYHFNYGRTQPYIKALGGDGHFNFPYNFATGNYFVIAGGGGLDYRLSRRWIARADFEYQEWPQFTFGAMNSVGGTVGIRYRIF